jgi:hypothetical protein
MACRGGHGLRLLRSRIGDDEHLPLVKNGNDSRRTKLLRFGRGLAKSDRCK